MGPIGGKTLASRELSRKPSTTARERDEYVLAERLGKCRRAAARRPEVGRPEERPRKLRNLYHVVLPQRILHHGLPGRVHGENRGEQQYPNEHNQEAAREPPPQSAGSADWTGTAACGAACGSLRALHDTCPLAALLC